MEEIANVRAVANNFIRHPRDFRDQDFQYMAKALLQLADAIQKLETRIQRQAEQIAQLQVPRQRE
ncbi:hypothetical protein [Bordetella bronchiseptica]|uniref:Uncharacterized protein n=1 Tax=Bordetella bronchiseptica 00-P-2796 TaxID=1331199 RepID=A0ABR4RF88_BORBO|nr:hypothetical protein [Bordetella bronchiseptica]KCV34938.1 hypothetical protein L490_2008 [Bordetella bronchiseptica 00-P-2796]SHT50849.1 Uncharacterised protein [Mycobacteroides abscessus subsp. abscessus]